ncbi:MAG: T9SS type A sorting domain-containing protein [Bacteroidetes bacterium]|nr:T9SS type A sorting domain-containing protein [Bacteroidota bacterium]
MKNLTLFLVVCCSYIGVKAQNWSEIKKIVASDRGAGDSFGWSTSVSGNYAIVGAYFDDEDELGGDTLQAAGSVYIFHRDSSGNWYQDQKLVASDRETLDRFGYAVAIDGNFAIVGAYLEAHDSIGLNSFGGAGSAYIFEKDINGIWNEVQKIVASDRYYNDWFGYSVSISGNRAVVGAQQEDNDLAGGNTKSNAGSAYIFERNGAGYWSQKQKIIASDRAVSDLFGYSVSINGDNIFVGAYQEDEDEIGANTMSSAGSVYVFKRDGSGSWNQTQKVVASDRASDDKFGYSVSVSENYAIIGAYLESEDSLGLNFMAWSGSAYIFEKDSIGNWNEAQKIVANDRTDNDRFGISVSIDRNAAIVGAYLEDENELGLDTMPSAGSAYIFERDTTGRWNQVQKIVSSDRQVDDWFGYSVAISGDYAMVGVFKQNTDSSGLNYMLSSGSTYIYEHPCTTTNETIYPTACGNYTVPSGDETYSTSGVYFDTIPNLGGCNLYLTIDLTILSSIDNTITNTAPTLTANQTGATYQWLDCDNANAIIPSETTQSFTATANGNYAVEVTVGSCVDTSACENISTVGVKETASHVVSIYPNPTSGMVNINLGSNNSSVNYSITSIEGKVVETGKTSTNSITIDLSKEGNGVYFVKINTENTSTVYKLIKQ